MKGSACGLPIVSIFEFTGRFLAQHFIFSIRPCRFQQVAWAALKCKCLSVHLYRAINPALKDTVVIMNIPRVQEMISTKLASQFFRSEFVAFTKVGIHVSCFPLRLSDGNFGGLRKGKMFVLLPRTEQ